MSVPILLGYFYLRKFKEIVMSVVEAESLKDVTKSLKEINETKEVKETEGVKATEVEENLGVEKVNITNERERVLLSLENKIDETEGARDLMDFIDNKANLFLLLIVKYPDIEQEVLYKMLINACSEYVKFIEKEETTEDFSFKEAENQKIPSVISPFLQQQNVIRDAPPKKV